MGGGAGAGLGLWLSLPFLYAAARAKASLMGSGLSSPSGGGGGEAVADEESGGSFCDDRLSALGAAAARGLRMWAGGKVRRRGGVDERMEDAAPAAAAAAIVLAYDPGGIAGDGWRQGTDGDKPSVCYPLPARRGEDSRHDFFCVVVFLRNTYTGVRIRLQCIVSLLDLSTRCRLFVCVCIPLRGRNKYRHSPCTTNLYIFCSFL